ncbi:hypothetical protein QTG54_005099 [Skeletonema marinoi]|uniref:Uncharacterized protein n=1 Tax=Skeletonema marinoi TaxID=267567 RepID=A0AAD9DEC5_9STRA|nr:hypothetical protein QTG54_005099 [Skeletonema marinoi]
MPSSSPTGKPTDQPSFPPTGSPYYPDWTNSEQLCINDGATPEYMKILQSANYLYMDKQECCEEHFSWRVRQCMDNDEPVYYRDGSSSICIKGETRDDYDIAFDTLEECCKEQMVGRVWMFAIKSQGSRIRYTIDLNEFAEPTNCQDADAIAKRMQEAMAPAMPSGTTILVVGLGAVTIENDVAFGTTQCGGSLAGQSYQGSWSLGVDYTDPPGTTTYATFRVFRECTSSGCTDAQSVQTLYDTTYQSMLAYAQGSMTQDIFNAAGTSPAVKQLQFVVVDSTSMTSDGTYKDPRNEEENLIEASSLTVEGELSVTGFDSSSLDAAELTEAISYFQAALETTLGLSYPVKVTDIVDGKIIYEILITADSSSDAVAAASSIETSLATDATRADIASYAVSEASSSPLASTFNAGFVIDANTETASTEIPVAKLTVEGQLATNQANFGSGDESYLEEAIYEVLLGKGVISGGDKVEVTGYVVGGVITYEVISYVDAASNVKAQTDSIISQLTQTSTTDQIAAAANSSPGCCTLTFNVLESIHLSTTGVPTRGWWPDWNWGESTCKTGGTVPAFMNLQYGQYFSNSKRECCEQWFPYDLKGCVGPTTGGSTKEFFLPNWTNLNDDCYKKLERDMDAWELADSYGSLEECCEKRFPYNFAGCCSAPGLGGCSLSTKTLYYPKDGKCVGGSEGEMEGYQKTFAEDSVRECCNANFWWNKKQCCQDSGGCPLG